jgi:peroxiredoxin
MKTIVFLISVCLIASTSVLSQAYPKGVQVNEMAPDFLVKNQFGEPISLHAELQKGPVVIVFYRGEWCPYCNKQLKRLEDSLYLIKEKGATLIAITPEKPENIQKTIQKTGASYSILFDEGLKIMKSYDVAFEVDNITIARYKNFNIDLVAANGNNGANLPVPALFIIDKKGKIIFRHFDPDYKVRVSVQEVLSHL